MSYSTLDNIPLYVLCYTICILLFRQGGEKVKFNFKSLINAPLVASVIAILLLIIDIRFPQPVDEAVGMLGDMIVPLSMVIIGASLGDMKLRETFADWRCYVFSAFRLIVVPVIVHFAMQPFMKDPMLLGMTTVLAGMPVAALSVMLTIEHGGDERLASKTVFISTLFSVLTIPLICWMLL